MRGKAGGRWIHRTKHDRALTIAEVLGWQRLVPTHLELQVRQLRWWQTTLMDREGNEALQGIFFRRLGADVEGPLMEDGIFSPNAHQRAEHLSLDLHYLASIELGREFVQAWQGNMRKLVMDEEC